jgi:PAS domain S-box-containing protein
MLRGLVLLACGQEKRRISPSFEPAKHSQRRYGNGRAGSADTEFRISRCMIRAMPPERSKFDSVDIEVLVDSIPALIHTARPDGHLDYFNKRWLEYLGVTLDRVTGWSWTTFIHPDDLEGILTKWRACLATGEVFEHETRVLRANGEYRWMFHRKVPLRDANGNIVKWYGSSLDFDERKTAEELLRVKAEELQRSEYYLAEGQRLAHMGSWAFDPDGFYYWSPELFRMHGLDPEGEPPSVQKYLDCIHPEDRDSTADLIKGIWTEGLPFDATKRIVRPNGEIRYIRCVGAYAGESQGSKQYVGSALDVTEQELLTQELRRREAYLQQILDLAPQLIVVLGPARERLYANRTTLEYLGVSLSEWQHKSFASDVHPDDWERIRTNVDQTLSSGRPEEFELRLRKRDGTYRWFFVHYSPIRDDKGETNRWYIAGTDIEERKQAEERLRQENVSLREEIDKASMFEEIVGTSPALKNVLSLISKVAPGDSTVLITGETGTGKELVARAIHRRSGRASRAFVSVNCAAIPRDLIASELFGHEKGAFTGATQQRLGRFELANGGTIFLDEVGELPGETQIALLRVLQEHEFERVGGNGQIRADVRVIAATNRDLQAAIGAGTFRSDLFYRLHVFPINLPSLRERGSDVPLLVEYFIDRYARKAGKKIKHVSKKTLELLQSYPWPGNIRELQNVIERSVILCETEIFTIDEHWLPQPVSREAKQPVELPKKLLVQEKDMIEAALKDTRGRVSGPAGAAVKLGIPRSTLESKIRSLKIDKNHFKTFVRT